MAIDPYLIRDTRFGGFRYPGFASVPGDTGGNVPAPAPVTAPIQPSFVPAPQSALEYINADGGYGPGADGVTGAASGPTSASGSVGVAAPSPAPSGLGTVTGQVAPTENVGLASFGRGMENVGKAVSVVSPAIGLGLGLVGYGAQYAARGVDPGLVSQLSNPGYTVSTPGYSVSSTPGISNAVGPSVGVGADPGAVGIGVSADPSTAANAPASVDVSADPGTVGIGVSADPGNAGAEAGAAGDTGASPGAAPGEAEGAAGAGGPGPGDAGAGGGDSGGGSGGGGGGSGDGGGDSGGGPGGPEMGGGPVVAPGGRPGVPVPRVAHQGEYVIQTPAAAMIGQDALQLINSEDFDPAKVRKALGLPAKPTAAFADPDQTPDDDTSPTGDADMAKDRTGQPPTGAHGFPGMQPRAKAPMGRSALDYVSAG